MPLTRPSLILQMFDWIRSHAALFAQRSGEIGDSAANANALLREHEDFNAAAIVNPETIDPSMRRFSF